MFTDAATEDFFRARLDQMIDLRQPLVVLASRMPWQQMQASLAHLLARKAHTGLAMPDLVLFGEVAQFAGHKSNAGRPRVPLRTMIALSQFPVHQTAWPLLQRLVKAPMRSTDSSFDSLLPFEWHYNLNGPSSLSVDIRP